VAAIPPPWGGVPGGGTKNGGGWGGAWRGPAGGLAAAGSPPPPPKARALAECILSLHPALEPALSQRFTTLLILPLLHGGDANLRRRVLQRLASPQGGLPGSRQTAVGQALLGILVALPPPTAAADQSVLDARLAARALGMALRGGGGQGTSGGDNAELLQACAEWVREMGRRLGTHALQLLHYTPTPTSPPTASPLGSIKACTALLEQLAEGAAESFPEEGEGATPLWLPSVIPLNEHAGKEAKEACAPPEAVATLCTALVEGLGSSASSSSSSLGMLLAAKSLGTLYLAGLPSLGSWWRARGAPASPFAAAALADWFSPAAGSPYSHSASAALCGAEALVVMHLGKVLPPPLEAPEGLRVLVRALLRAADSSPVVGAGAALARCAAQVLCSTGSAEDLVDALSVEVPPFAAVHGIITDALVARE